MGGLLDCRVDYPYSDAGVLDTGALLQDPVYSPKGVWLGSPMGTIFGTAVNGNASAVILLINVSFLAYFDICIYIELAEQHQLWLQHKYQGLTCSRKIFQKHGAGISHEYAKANCCQAVVLFLPSCVYG